MSTVADQFAATSAAAGVKRIYGVVGDSLNRTTDTDFQSNKQRPAMSTHILCRVIADSAALRSADNGGISGARCLSALIHAGNRMSRPPLHTAARRYITGQIQNAKPTRAMNAPLRTSP